MLTEALRRLPGVGPKSAQRMAYHLMQHDRDGAVQIARAMSHAIERLKHCARCHTFTEHEQCDTCSDTLRDSTLLCVVESPADQLMIEQTLTYKGLYFVLMGKLSPLDGIGPKEIHLDRLVARVANDEVREVVIATNFTPEGEATAHAIETLLRSKGLVDESTRRISRLARGVPVGGELEYIDLGTIAQAMRDRKKI